MSDFKYAFENALKKQLAKDGVSNEWIEKHLIVETLDGKKKKKKKKGVKNVIKN